MTSAPRIHRYLPGGMECCLEESHLAPLVALQLWVKVGSLDEEDDEAGIAHVLEHMVFKGTRHFPRSNEVVSLVESQGGELDASTSFDHTHFQIVLPSRELDLGLDALFDLVFHPLLPEPELPRELEVVLEEVRRMRDNPGTLASLEVFRAAMAGTRMERPIIGFPETIEKFTPARVAAFHQKWYRPNNVMLVAAGDFDAQALWAKLAERAAKLQPGALPARHRAAPRRLEAPTRILRGPWQGTRLHFACPSPTLEESDTPAWHMFTSLLGIGEASRLVRKVHEEKGLVPDIDAGIFLPKSPVGLFTISFFAETDKAAEALAASIGEISRVATEGPSLQEMLRVQSSMVASRTYDKESVEGIARGLGYSLLTSRGLEFDDWYEGRLAAVTQDDVRTVAKKVLEHIERGETILAAAVSEEDALDTQGLARALTGAHRSTRTTTTAKPRISAHAPDVQQYEIALAGGRNLHVNVRRVPRLPIMSAVLAVRGGSTLGIHPSTMHLMTQMLVRGSERQSYNSFVDELEDNSSGIAAFSTPDISGLHMDSLARHGMRCLEMTLDAFLLPAFHEEQWERLQRDTLTGILAQKDSPGIRLRRMVLSLLFGTDHPYGSPALADEDEVSRITLDEVREQHRRLMSTDPIILSIAGDFDIDAILDLVASHFPAQEKPVPFSIPVAPPIPRKAMFAFDALEREQAHVAVALRAFPVTDARRTAIELGATILGGQGGRLFSDLRDARALAYALGTSHSPALHGGHFGASMGTAPHKVSEALSGLWEHIERMAQESPTVAEIERARRSILGSRNIDAQTMHYQASQLSASDLFGLGFDNFLRFEERLFSVTPDMVRNAFADMLAQGPFHVAVVGPDECRAPAQAFHSRSACR